MCVAMHLSSGSFFPALGLWEHVAKQEALGIPTCKLGLGTRDAIVSHDC